MSPKFRTSFDKCDIDSVSGSGFDMEYSARYDDSGTLVLEVVGKKDIYSEIQSYKDSVDINNIMLRYQRGDLDVFNQVKGFYEDVSEMPKDYAGVLNNVEKTRQFFDTLPVDVKKMFDNDSAKFLVAFSDPDFISRFSGEPVVDDPIKEVVENES